MTTSLGGKARIALLFAVLAVAASGAQALSCSGSAVEMSAFVPPVLLVSVDEFQDNSLVLVGFVGSTHGKFRQASGRRFFELEDDRPCDLGSFRLFSNIPEKYKITILSQNGALLLPSSGDRDDGIPYRLKVGETWIAGEDGVFVYIGSGKSVRGGSPISLELQASQPPAKRRSDLYFDSLTFAVSVE
jgi:hypothetical protein